MTRALASRAARFFLAAAIITITAVAAACRQAPPPKRYELVGQILSIKEERREVTIKHEDIQGFMPGMTMPFKVEEPALLVGRKPGDLIKATLVVGEVEAYLESLNVTGHADIDPASAPTDLPPVLEPGKPVSDAELLDQSGRPRPLSSFKGHRVALTFVYTRCPLPEFCPMMERNFAAVQQLVKETPALADVQLVAVTMDPENDTPDVLRAHAQGLGADPRVWSFLTSDPETVRTFAEQFGVHYESDAQNTWQLIHNLRTAVIAPDGTLVKIESGNAWTPANLVADLQKVPAPVN